MTSLFSDSKSQNYNSWRFSPANIYLIKPCIDALSYDNSIVFHEVSIDFYFRNNIITARVLSARFSQEAPKKKRFVRRDMLALFLSFGQFDFIFQVVNTSKGNEKNNELQKLALNNRSIKQRTRFNKGAEVLNPSQLAQRRCDNVVTTS